MQSDVLFPNLTVRETLVFSAQLRLPDTVTDEEKFDRVRVSACAQVQFASAVRSTDQGRENGPCTRLQVEKVITSLELDRVADSRIGDVASGQSGLSGGQKRRVTVGIELLTYPSTHRRHASLYRIRTMASDPPLNPRPCPPKGLLFLDEPTTGLVRSLCCASARDRARTQEGDVATVRCGCRRFLQDSYSSLRLVKTLRKLANQNRTVICTIHQPRAEIFGYRYVRTASSRQT